MSGLWQDDHRYLRSDPLHRSGQHFTQRLFAADHEDRNHQLGLRKLREILRGLRKRNEIGPTHLHASGTGVRRGVGSTIGWWNRARLVGGEVVPEVLEKSALAAAHQRFGRRAIK